MIDLETSSVDDIFDSILKLQQIEIGEKQTKLLNRILKEGDKE